MVTNLSCRRCLIGPQKGVSKTSKGHVLQANWASFQIQMTIYNFKMCENNLHTHTKKHVNPSLTGKIIFHKYSGCFV